MAKILILDDDRVTTLMLSILVKAKGHKVLTASDGASALALLAAEPQDLVISDVSMFPMDGIEFTTQLRKRGDATPVIMISADSTTETAARARAAGAVDYLVKPLMVEVIVRCMERALASNCEVAKVAPVDAQAAPTPNFPVAVSTDIHNVLPGEYYSATRESLALLADRSRVLFEAESGMLGPELLEVLHASGSARDGPLVIRDLRTASADDFAAGLFDDQGLPGNWFKEAAVGTLVLLTIEQLPLPIQKKLDSALRQNTNCRQIFTTLSDPETLVAQGRLDAGLFFRLAISWLRLPPVRECELEIPELFKACLARFIYGAEEIQIEEPVARALRAYDWPENIEEMRRVAGTTASRLRSAQVTMAQLPERFFKVRMPTLSDALLSAQTEHILRAHRVLGSTMDVAEMLKITVHQVEAVLEGAHTPLFQIQEMERVPTASPFATATLSTSAPAKPAVTNVLLVIEEPVLRAAAEVCIPERGLHVTIARDGLAALAVLAAWPDYYAIIVQAGVDRLFTPVEMAGQLSRVAPKAKFTTLGKNCAGQSVSVSDLEAEISRLSQQAA